MVADPQALPARVGRYEIERFLGQGGMGRLYLAKDPMLGRPLAIKLIRGSPVWLGGGPNRRRPMLVRVLATISNDADTSLVTTVSTPTT